MKEFIQKLYKQDIIGLDEPNNTISGAYVKKSKRYEQSAKLLYNHDRFEECVQLSYYSTYYCALALLFRVGILSKNHDATNYLVQLFFDINTSFLSDAKKKRIQTQYYVSHKSVQADAKNILRYVKDFQITTQNELAKINTTKIEEVKNTFNDFFTD